MATSQSVLATMKFDAGFDIDMESFSHTDQIFQDVVQLFEEQNLRKLMTMRIKLPVTEIKEWVYNMENQDNSTISGKIAGNQVLLTPVILFEVFGLVNGDDDLEITSDEFHTALEKMGHSSGNPNHLLNENFIFGCENWKDGDGRGDGAHYQYQCDFCRAGYGRFPTRMLDDVYAEL